MREKYFQRVKNKIKALTHTACEQVTEKQGMCMK